MNITIEQIDTQLSVSATANVPLALAVGIPSSLRGPTGPVGPVGPVGPQGPEVATLIFDQSVPSAFWVINHDLQRFPNVVVVDSTERIVEGDVVYLSANTVTVTFQAAFSGTAYIN